MHAKLSPIRNSSRRDHLVMAALKLFNKYGYRATGIDTILAESGVAKMTLYKHFKSKDELIVAAMHKSNEDFIARMNKAIIRLTAKQRCDARLAKLMAFFDALHEWFNSKTFFGCNFINASAEYPDAKSPVHVAAAHFKRKLLQMIEELLENSQRNKQPAKISQQIYLIVEGAIVTAHTVGNKTVAKTAKDAALRLLKSYST